MYPWRRRNRFDVQGAADEASTTEKPMRRRLLEEVLTFSHLELWDYFYVAVVS